MVVSESSESLEAIVSNTVLSLIQAGEVIEEENDFSIPEVLKEIIGEMSSGRYWCSGSFGQFTTTRGSGSVNCPAE